MKKTNNEKTGLTAPKPRADETARPQSKAARKALNEKRITENVPHGFTKSAHRPDTASTIQNPDVDNENSSMEHYRRADSRWSHDGKMEDKQPRSGPGKMVCVEVLDIMPDSVPQPEGKSLRSITKEKKTIAAVQSGQWDFDASQSVFNSQ
jgi:hypothetical protein